MKTSKLLPFILIALLAGCGKKEEAAKSEAPAVQTPPTATAPAAPAPDTSTAPTASTSDTQSSQSSSASAPSGSAPAADASGSPATPAASGASAGGGDLATGEKVFTASCAACHATGVLGAPKLGDKAAWEPRLKQGKDTLHTHAINGIRQMPPKGGNAALKDADVKAAVDYMVSKAS